MYWMITNRNIEPNRFGDSFSDLTFWQNDAGPVDDFKKWTSVSQDDFKNGLIAVTDKFRDPIVTPSKDQQHLNIFVHGFDNDWVSAVQRYKAIVDNLFSGEKSMGVSVLFSWPSKGSVAGYLPDRAEARQSADDFADVLSELYDWMSMKQAAAAENPANGCKAKTSVIAHSMGNYVVENAMNAAWTRKNRPLLMSLISQLVMVAADVDNDLFRSGENVQHGDGEGIANLSYRITAMYSGRDEVLGASAGLKHFGKRRLGRSGLDLTYPLPDNVWDIDCSKLIDSKLNGLEVHGAYFSQPPCFDVMRAVLEGQDRTVMADGNLLPPALAKNQTAGD